MMGGLGFDVQSMTALNVMTEDVLRSNEIEGVILNSDKVRSSIAKHLGIDTAGLPQPDRYTEGVVQIMMDAVTNCNKPLTPERLFNWHAALFPTGRSGMYPITVGAYRTGINSDNTVTDPVLKAAVAHLWFVAIHPFDDGNGRLTRTITDMQLAKADGFHLRFYSMSAEILREKKTYYEILEHTTGNSTDITEWLEWFLNTMKSSILRAEETVKRVVSKSSFWQRHREIPMNERQVKVVNMIWDGFTGKLTSSKWAKITKTSQATALRDITDLIEKGILIAAADGGRSSNYLLKDNADQYSGKEC